MASENVPFIAGGQDIGLAADPTFDLYEPQLTGAWNAALNVVAPLLELPVSGIKAQAPLNCRGNLPASSPPVGAVGGQPWRQLAT